MANQVYANGREVSCKAGSGKTICAFPDVCFTPPQTPATPPGVPVPYPNTGMDSETASGSKTVKISDKEVMLKNKSYFKSSTGDEAGCAPKKGVVTSVNRGKVYFNSWSMDVKVEGENIVRHLDLTTHNHASRPGQTPPFPFTAEMMVGSENCQEILEKEGIDVHQHKDKDCPRGHQSDHILQNACFANTRNGPGISSCPKYSVSDAPCICLKGKSTTKGTQHFKKTVAQRNMQNRWKLKKSVTYQTVRDENLNALAEARPMSKKARRCIARIVDHYFKKYLKLKPQDPVRVPGSGKFRRPSIK